MKINKEHIAYLEENYGKNILPLSIFDNAVRPGGNPMEDLLFYKKGTSILKLRESLVKTVEHYNLFSSRLIMIEHNKFALQYCTDGAMIKILAPLKAASNNINIEDIKKMMVHVQTLPGEPLFAVTGIPIEDGILGAISCSHAVCDGISLILFLYTWGCIIEGKDFPLPSTQRLFQGSPIRSDKINKAFIPPLSELSDAIQNRVERNKNIKTYSKREYFSDEFLDEIKNKAKSENEKCKISSNQIINSCLLKKYHSVILPDAEKIRLRVPINLRDVHPDIDALYIGNAFFISFAEFTKDEINKMSMYQIAYRLKETIKNARNENYIKEIAYLSKYGVDFKADIFKNYPPYNVDTDILSTNLTHLNDLESLGLGSKVGSLLNIDSTVPTCFTMLKEKSDRMFAEITSRYSLI